MKGATLAEEVRKIEITEKPLKWVRNELKATAQSMVYGKPFPQFRCREPYVIGPPRDRMT